MLGLKKSIAHNTNSVTISTQVHLQLVTWYLVISRNLRF